MEKQMDVDQGPLMLVAISENESKVQQLLHAANRIYNQVERIKPFPPQLAEKSNSDESMDGSMSLLDRIGSTGEGLDVVIGALSKIEDHLDRLV